MPAGCLVVGCSKPSVSRGLCGTHRARKERHGHLDQTRAPDWGQREKHPAYRAWCGLRRHHKADMPVEWADDFWVFARDVPAKPESSRACKTDKSRPWGPGNFFWKEPRTSVAYREDKAAYMREWQRQHRAANRWYGKDADLRRTYGVDLAWYDAQSERQGHRCAICGQEESAVIRGRNIALAVDHCHDTGVVRGLLCRACNNAIGIFRHDVGLLQRAIEYLAGTPAVHAPGETTRRKSTGGPSNGK